jgi:hypothetical protein
MALPLFVGGERDDFIEVLTGTTVSSNAAHSTNTAHYRTAYARAAVGVQHGSSNNSTYLRTPAFTPRSSMSVTARFYFSSAQVAGAVWLWLGTGGSARLRLAQVSSTSGSLFRLEKFDGTTPTTLATSSVGIVTNTLCRVDCIVEYGVSGRVRVYINQELALDYSGDVTAAGTAALDTAAFLSAATGSLTYWSEVIVHPNNTRAMSLRTLVPDAVGDASEWVGAYTDLDEITASETDFAASASVGQVMAVNCTGMPAGVTGVTVAALKVTASAIKGGTGPATLALGVRSGGTTAFAPARPLDVVYSTGAISEYWETNPVTGQAWTAANIDALQLAFRSEA